MAYYDALTGLANRRLFNDFLQRETEKLAHGETASGVVCFIDLDEPVSGYQSTITQSVVELTNLSNSLSAEITLIVVGH